ncbi:MAG: tetratricopeptide repeat protein [Planctomycetes bacterium]|nr:tetratricopeptide repeat protein [Planctomycetota bacterium]
MTPKVVAGVLLAALASCAIQSDTPGAGPYRARSARPGDGGARAVPVAAAADERGTVAEAATPQAREPAAANASAGDRVAPSSKQEPSASVGPGLSAAELAIFRDPAFRRRFAESYLAETDIEPRIDDGERNVMLELADLITGERLDEALRLCESNRGVTASAVFDFTAGNLQFQQDRFDEAAAAYRAAVEKFPKFRRAWAMLGQCHYRRGEFRPAVEALTRVIELGGADPVTYGLLGVSHSRLEHFVAAETAFRTAMMLAPDTINWELGLADSFYRQQRFADAVALFQGLIDRHPDRAELWLAQGEAYARLGQPMAAAANFEMVDQLGGANFDCLANLGDIYATEQLHELAVGAYERALERDPQAAPDRAIRAADFLGRNGALDGSAALIGAIERIHADDLSEVQTKALLRLRARLALATGAGDEEARVLEELVRLDPLDGDALIKLGLHARRTGELEKAIFYFERAESIEAFAADAKVRHAQALVDAGRIAEAVKLVREAQKIKPRDNVQQFLEQIERLAPSR